MSWTLRPASWADVERIAELRALVLRADLERLGRYDEVRVRQRFRGSFDPAVTQVVEAGGGFAGSVALRPDGDGTWLEHFYLAPAVQGQGIGTAILRGLLADVPGDVRLNVLQGSSARRLYERHGFTTYAEDAVDVWMLRAALSDR